MKTLLITAYPYAVQYGYLKAPEDLAENDADEYVKEHWNEIRFNDAELDYCGTDFEFELVT